MKLGVEEENAGHSVVVEAGAFVLGQVQGLIELHRLQLVLVLLLEEFDFGSGSEDVLLDLGPKLVVFKVDVPGGVDVTTQRVIDTGIHYHLVPLFYFLFAIPSLLQFLSLCLLAPSLDGGNQVIVEQFLVVDSGGLYLGDPLVVPGGQIFQQNPPQQRPEGVVLVADVVVELMLEISEVDLLHRNQSYELGELREFLLLVLEVGQDELEVGQGVDEFQLCGLLTKSHKSSVLRDRVGEVVVVLAHLLDLLEELLQHQNIMVFPLSS